MTSAPWEAPAPSTNPASDLPSIGTLFDATLNDVRDHFGGYAMAALGLFVVQFPLTLVLIIVMYAGMFLGAWPGFASDDPDLMSLGMMSGGGIALVLGLGLLFLVMPPMQASLVRAIDAHQRLGTPLAFNAAFSTAFTDLPKVYFTTLVLGSASILGLMLCYFPILLVGLAFHFAWPLAIVGRRSTFDATNASVQHVFRHPGWNLKVWGTVFLGTLVLSYIPIIGTAAAVLCGAAFTLRAARAAYGADLAA